MADDMARMHFDDMKIQEAPCAGNPLADDTTQVEAAWLGADFDPARSAASFLSGRILAQHLPSVSGRAPSPALTWGRDEPPQEMYFGYTETCATFSQGATCMPPTQPGVCRSPLEGPATDGSLVPPPTGDWEHELLLTSYPTQSCATFSQGTTCLPPTQPGTCYRDETPDSLTGPWTAISDTYGS